MDETDPAAIATERAIAAMGRAASISGVAAVAGSFFGMLMVFGDSSGWRLALMFTLVGSFLLLLPAYVWLRNKGFDRRDCYGVIVTVGFVGGTLMLGLLSAGGIDSMATGAFFGMLTATFWVAAHWLTVCYRRSATK